MMRRVFVDVETTGLKVEEGDRVIEVAAVAYEGLRKLDQFHSLVNPSRVIAPEATEIHGITNEDLADKPPFKDIAVPLADFLRDCELIAHNADFDVGFLGMEFKRAGMPAAADIVAKVVDSLEEARELYPGQSNNLDALARRHGIDLEQRRPVHGALIDAEILAEVYHLMNTKQYDLDLMASAKGNSLAMPTGNIEQIRMPHDDEAAARHEEYLNKMEAESGVRPLALDKS